MNKDSLIDGNSGQWISVADGLIVCSKGRSWHFLQLYGALKMTKVINTCFGYGASGLFGDGQLMLEQYPFLHGHFYFETNVDQLLLISETLLGIA